MLRSTLNKNLIYRSIVVSLFLLFNLLDSHAQFELRSNPLSYIVGNGNIILDYHVSRNVSFELLAARDVGISLEIGPNSQNYFKRNAYKFRMLGKYYYDERRGADGWFSSLLVSHKRAIIDEISFLLFSRPAREEFIQNSITSGFGGGYKWITYKGFVLELSAGYERSIFVRRSNLAKEQVTTDFITNQFFINVSLGYKFNKKSKSR